MTPFISLLNQIAGGQDLTDEQAESAVRAMMSGEVSPALAGAFLWGLKTKAVLDRLQDHTNTRREAEEKRYAE